MDLLELPLGALFAEVLGMAPFLAVDAEVCSAVSAVHCFSDAAVALSVVDRFVFPSDLTFDLDLVFFDVFDFVLTSVTSLSDSNSSSSIICNYKGAMML